MRHAFLPLLAVLLAGACYSPLIENGQYSCKQDDRCPEGFVCDACRRCVRRGQSFDAGASCSNTSVDLTMTVTSPDLGCPTKHLHSTEGCTNNSGLRPCDDPDLPNIAFCPAAWSLPGVTTPQSNIAMCANAPGPTGAGCSVADNCAGGWHVCKGDTDAALHGLANAICANPPAGIWITRQNGGNTDNCSIAGVNNIFGCGTIAGTATSSCTVLVRDWHGSQCVPPWDCGGTDSSLEGDIVTKQGLAQGGVLCCRDP